MLGVTKSAFPVARPYPVNLRLAGKPVLVVGAGNVAVRKVGQLLASGAAVTVVGLQVDPRLFALAAESRGPGSGSVSIEQRAYEVGEVAAYMLAITCTDDGAVNSRVHDDGLVAGVWVNSADDPTNCEFTLPSVVRTGDLQIAISTEGRSPALAMWLRQRFEHEFGGEWGELLDVLSDVRDEARRELGTSELAGWIGALDSVIPRWLERANPDEARETLRRHLGLKDLEQVR